MIHPHYAQCTACGKIVRDLQSSLVRLDQPCPECGNTGNCRRAWPSAFRDSWRDAIQNHAVSSETDRLLLAILLCAAAEHFQERLNRAIVFHQSPGCPHATLLLDAHDGKHRQADLFKSLTKTPLKQACNDEGFQHFYQAWENIATARNKFVHGTPAMKGRSDDELVSDLERVRSELVEVFRVLENRFAT